MVKLTKIYTKHGDSGMTSLGSGDRRAKHDTRISAIGTIDETNSFVGLARSKINIILSNVDNKLLHSLGTHKGYDIQRSNYRQSSLRNIKKSLVKKLINLDEQLMKIQNDLFDLGGDLTTLEKGKKSVVKPLRIVTSQVEALELEIDKMNEDLTPLRSFVLPGGNEIATFLHVARTVCRRAERLVNELAETEKINPEAFKYINRLSDYLFVAARWINNNGKDDILWIPGKNR